MRTIECILCLIAFFAASLFNLAWLVEWLLVLLILYLAGRLLVISLVSSGNIGKPKSLMCRAFFLPQEKARPMLENKKPGQEETQPPGRIHEYEEDIPTTKLSTNIEKPQNNSPMPVEKKHEESLPVPVSRKEKAQFICHVAVGKGIVYNKNEVVFEESNSAYPTFALYEDGTLRLTGNVMGSSHSEAYYDKRNISYVYDFIGKPKVDKFMLAREIEHPRVRKDGNDVVLQRKGKVEIA